MNRLPVAGVRWPGGPLEGPLDGPGRRAAETGCPGAAASSLAIAFQPGWSGPPQAHRPPNMTTSTVTTAMSGWARSPAARQGSNRNKGGHEDDAAMYTPIAQGVRESLPVPRPWTRARMKTANESVVEATPPAIANAGPDPLARVYRDQEVGGHDPERDPERPVVADERDQDLERGELDKRVDRHHQRMDDREDQGQQRHEPMELVRDEPGPAR